MLCQNCKRSDAHVHLKRIINGEAAEIHLCSACAASLGVSDVMAGFSPFADFSAGVLSAVETGRMSNKTLHCETCGFTFQDIARTGSPGCSDCYRTFAQKLRPTLIKLHGRAVYKGKIPVEGNAAAQKEDSIEALKERLNKAIDEQNFELAAVLRDEIRALTEQEGQ
ncbi:MAG: UvrB/UvrC motif-containing protein [Clostridia bacterium]|nr:UvrB/UvrC motif-containing protein [Clostridia bacterium]